MERDLSDSLLVFLGEGNFSFSVAVSTAASFTALNCQLIATDYIPEIEAELGAGADNLSKDQINPRSRCNVELLKENVEILKGRGYPVLLDVDATLLHEHQPLLKLLRDAFRTSNLTKLQFIFNFPHVKSKKMKIGLNRDLLRGFFISCDKVLHCLNNCQEEDLDSCSCDLTTIQVLPVVSLCAGQSGISEVDSIPRSWGDSWQINDMAAHGNFVCVSVQPFTESTIYSLINSSSFNPTTYQSSYYRLQTGVSFTTDKALSLGYQHRKHTQPRQTDRLHSTILRCRDDKAEKGTAIGEFVQFFRDISKEYIIWSQTDPQERPYHHVVHCDKDLDKINSYLIKSDAAEKGDVSVDLVGNKVLVSITQKDQSRTTVIVGDVTISADKGDGVAATTMALYVDTLLELKYPCDYRFLLSCSGMDSARSLYPHTHEFHISFWVNQSTKDGDYDNNESDASFSKTALLQVLLDVYGLMLKGLQLIEEYVDEKGKRVSFCWRVLVQSLEGALSRVTAHQMYLQLRHELSCRLQVEVR